jgi:dTDP-4-amino-4,6-dideoxygalactose transaminase
MFCNATSAMEAALFACSINKGAIVGTTAFVIPSSYAPAKHLGAKLKFLDISLNTLNFDTDILDNKIINMKALIVTHFYGNPCDMKKIMKWAKINNVYVVEDCSHAHGANCQGKPVGTWVHIGIFSLQGSKTVAAGEGAIVISNDPKLMLKMAAYGHQEKFHKFNIRTNENLYLPPFGYGKKMRIHPLGAISALEDLKMLKFKNLIFASWIKEIDALSLESNVFKLPKVMKSSKRGGFCQGIPLILKNKKSTDKLMKILKSNRVNCFLRNYTDYIIQFSDFISEEQVRSKFHNSYNAFSQVLFIPFEQFILPWRWIKFKSALKVIVNE